MNNIFYITDMVFPSNRAQAVHIFKMLDNFSEFINYKYLISPYVLKNYGYSKIKKNYSLHSNKKIFIKSFFKKKKINFIYRLLFGLNVALFLRNKKDLIITRSFYASFFLSVFKIKHFLEIHQELKGLTKFLFIFCKAIKSKYIIRIIFISSLAKKKYDFIDKKKHIILHDGVDLKDFKFNAKISKKIKNIYYIGSFYKGRGIEKILDIAKRLNKYNFYIYGKRKENINSILKNTKIFFQVPYNKIPKIISKADLLLLPYDGKVSINSSNYQNDISQFMSPIKMFEYLASGIPILSSNLKVLREVLVNQKNSILIDKYWDITEWIKQIESINQKYKLRKKISSNAIKTAKKNTWENRAKQIYKIFSESFNDKN